MGMGTGAVALRTLPQLPLPPRVGWTKSAFFKQKQQRIHTLIVKLLFTMYVVFGEQRLMHPHREKRGFYLLSPQLERIDKSLMCTES